MSENAANNKRIAKNTLMLYFRMLLLMGVSLYTSRVVLNALGVEDYGIYNVVGGVVAMFTMISGSLSAAISRFITFELGKGNQERLNTIFSTSVIIQLVISVIIVILVESVGIWFLENKMVIPCNRLLAAKWLMHLSMITLVINLISIPYNAAIIAHEKMSAFAYISILDAICKLMIAYFITISPIDKLIFYAIMMSVVALLVRFVYGVYCSWHFAECKHLSLTFDKLIFKEMFAFAGWSFIGSISGLLSNQGGNILLNIFGGPAVNAARAISMQVAGAITQFSDNFITALNPQITKSYATSDKEYMITLISQGARLSFYMLLVLSLPILINTEYILSLWLTIVPAHAVLFVQLSLIAGMVGSLSSPLITALLATGVVRDYQLTVGMLNLMNFPLSYLLLKIGLFPEIIVCVSIFMSLCCLKARLNIAHKLIGLSQRDFFCKIIVNVFGVFGVAVVIPYTVRCFIEINFLSFIFVSIIAIASTITSIYIIGCNPAERHFINSKIHKWRN